MLTYIVLGSNLYGFINLIYILFLNYILIIYSQNLTV